MSAWFDRAESGKHAVFVQNLGLNKAHLPQQINLKKERTGGIFGGNVGKNMVAVGFVFEVS